MNNTAENDDLSYTVIANQSADWCGNLLLKMGIPTGADAPSE